MPAISVSTPPLPRFGLGTGPLRGDVGIGLMVEAIRMGYRLLDTGAWYRNEREVGEAVRASGVARGEIIVLTKIWLHNISGKDLPRHAEEALGRLGLDYIDLLMPHRPNPDIPMAETIAALNDVRRHGITRQIGLSNFPTRMMAEAQKLSAAPLIANEVEYQPYLNQDAVIAACEAMGMTMITHCPLDRGGALFTEPAITAAAARLGKSPAQIVLRWHVQQGAVPIPATHSVSRLRENIDVFDFALSDAEMAAISGLAKKTHRICDPPVPYEWD